MLETIIGSGILGFGVFSGFHALLRKRDPRSALGWIVVCVLVPALGALLYWTFGVNRILTRTRRLQKRGRFASIGRTYGDAEVPLAEVHPGRAETMSALVRISERVTRRPLLHGNKVEPLHNGEQAYPEMLEAIRHAEKSIYLCTYLFDTDAAGMEFIDALGASAARGVDVRILVDAIGETYSRPRASKVLRRRQAVKVARFLPLAPTLRGLRVNLRNHRKVLLVDSEIGFTGGMNIGQRHLVNDENNKKCTVDLHFRVTGPIIYALEDIFFEDWIFATGDEPHWSDDDEVEPIEPTGDALCRAISDGPNEDYEVLTWILVGALGAARERVQIMTPYFIPSRELISALNATVLRGVTVEIILPRHSNLPFVDWATQDMLEDVLRYGVEVYREPPPFNHTKLLIVDRFYVNLGSANLDPRSLRLNFELNLEVYDAELAETLSDHFDRVRERSTPVTREDLAKRNIAVKLRDAVAKLASPYL